jgi:hypothetical protein
LKKIIDKQIEEDEKEAEDFSIEENQNPMNVVLNK